MRAYCQPTIRHLIQILFFFSFKNIYLEISPATRWPFYSGLNVRYLLFPWYRIYASVNWVGIGSDNGLSPRRCQAIIWTNADILSIRTQRTYFNEILFQIQIYSLRKRFWTCRLRNGGHFVQGEMRYLRCGKPTECRLWSSRACSVGHRPSVLSENHLACLRHMSDTSEVQTTCDLSTRHEIWAALWWNCSAVR